MPRAVWPLRSGSPIVEVELSVLTGGVHTRSLLADTGAGQNTSVFQLILSDADCQLCGGNPGQNVSLGGAYSGSFPVYFVRLQIPALNVNQYVAAVGVPAAPAGFDGIACFRFLNQFTYGNFGNRNQFGLET